MEPFLPFPPCAQPAAPHHHHGSLHRPCTCRPQARARTRISPNRHHSPASGNRAQGPTLLSSAAATCCCSAGRASAEPGRISLPATATKAGSSRRQCPLWKHDAGGFAVVPAARPEQHATPAGRPSIDPCACAAANSAIWTAAIATASLISSVSRVRPPRCRSSPPSDGCKTVFQAGKSSCRAGSPPPLNARHSAHCESSIRKHTASSSSQLLLGGLELVLQHCRFAGRIASQSARTRPAQHRRFSRLSGHAGD